MTSFLVSCSLAWALAQAETPLAFLYKWTDAKGVVHITDRMNEVPPELRAKFSKRREEAEARAKSGKKPPPPVVRATNDEAPVGAESAYQRMKRLEAEEKKVRDDANRLRGLIAVARAKQAELLEERGFLASNPVLNAAQPARVARMGEIDQLVAELEQAVASHIGELTDMAEKVDEKKLPSEWVTGLEE